MQDLISFTIYNFLDKFLGVLSTSLGLQSLVPGRRNKKQLVLVTMNIPVSGCSSDANQEWWSRPRTWYQDTGPLQRQLPSFVHFGTFSTLHFWVDITFDCTVPQTGQLHAQHYRLHAQLHRIPIQLTPYTLFISGPQFQTKGMYLNPIFRWDLGQFQQGACWGGGVHCSHHKAKCCQIQKKHFLIHLMNQGCWLEHWWWIVVMVTGLAIVTGWPLWQVASSFTQQLWLQTQNFGRCTILKWWCHWGMMESRPRWNHVRILQSHYADRQLVCIGHGFSLITQTTLQITPHQKLFISYYASTQLDSFILILMNTQTAGITWIPTHISPSQIPAETACIEFGKHFNYHMLRSGCTAPWWLPPLNSSKTLIIVLGPFLLTSQHLILTESQIHRFLFFSLTLYTK